MKINQFNRKTLLIFALCLAVSLLFGIAGIFVLRWVDASEDNPQPLSGGQMVDLSPFGFTLRVPEDYTVSDLTEGNLSWLTLVLGNERDQFYIYCYQNESRDSIEDYEPLEMVRYYMQSGCDQVRTRLLGNRTFITYRAAVESLTGDEYWYVYETWNPDLHLVIETRMLPVSFLPIMATMVFPEDGST